jgi:hypothetical protein
MAADEADGSFFTVRSLVLFVVGGLLTAQAV